jgi:hypothetical protein
VNQEAQAFVSELLGIITEGGAFTESEARRLVRSVRAATPEELPGNIEKVVVWARAVRAKQAVLDVILQLAEHDGVIVKPSEDGTDVEIGLNT